MRQIWLDMFSAYPGLTEAVHMNRRNGSEPKPSAHS